MQRGAGEGALIPDEAFAEAGAQLVDEAPFDCDVVVKVAAPSAEEIARLGSDTVLIGFLGPLTNGEGVRAIAATGATSFAHGGGAAHQPRAVDGRAVFAGQHLGLPVGADRRPGARALLSRC